MIDETNSWIARIGINPVKRSVEGVEPCCSIRPDNSNTGCFFSLVPPLKVQSTKNLILARLGVSRPIYVNVDSPNLGFPYFYFLGGYQLKKHPVP